MAKRKEEMNEACNCKCHKGHGWAMLILGLLVLANVYGNIVNWASFLGLILVIAGICKVVMKKK